jgi:hydroxymethylbilane synthase
MKDVPTQLPDGLEIAAILPREDPRDVLLARDGVTNIEDLPKGATLGTASIRRQAQALAIRLDLNIVLLRGNVDTRLSKLKSGEVDATFLARAGLNRLGRDEAKLEPVAIESMIPAPAQGCVGIEIRSDDDEARDLLLPLNDTKSAVAAICERGFLKALDGSCRTPIAAYACFNDGRIWLRAEALMPDGTQRWRDEVSAELNSDDRLEAERIGFDLGQSVKARGGETLAKIVEATG